jgi:ATP-binding cassette subfamily B protein
MNLVPGRILLDYLSRYTGRYAAGSAFLLLASLFSLAIPWLVKNAIEALGTGGGAPEVRGYALGILALAVAHGVARLGSRFAIIGAAQGVEFDLRNGLYAHLQRLPAEFYQTHRTGDLMSRASNDVAAVKLLVGFGALTVIATTIAFLGTLGAMLAIDPWLTLWAMAPYPVLILLAKRFNGTVHRQSEAVQEQLGALSAKVQENLAGMTVVRAYSLEPVEIHRFERLNAEYLRRSLTLARTQAAFTPLLGLIAGVGTLTVLWLGGTAVLEGRITLGAFVAFNAYLAHLAWPTIALGWTISMARRGLAAMGRIAEVLSVVPSITDAEEPVDFPGARRPARGEPDRTPAAVEFRDLTFAYAGREPALRNVTLTIPEGRTLAVVGPTGSGKSTLGALILRLFDPPEGRLLVFGEDVRRLRLHQLRRAVGSVPQESFLFSRTLRDNLALGVERQVDEGRLEGVARMARLLEEIHQWPEGWETVVGERGLTLSGGQRQRAALARALLLDPRILILDDAFASVDAETEAEIFSALREYWRGRTLIVITHRLRVAPLVDSVVVLAEGRIVEEGRHDALLDAGGLYARLWRTQQLEEELSRGPAASR